MPEGEIDQLRGELAELRRSRKRLAEATTADRRALERAFHDGVQQHLVALAVDLQRLAKLVDGQPADAKALVDEMAANLRDALAEGTDHAQQLYPSMLEAAGFAAAIRTAAERAGVSVLVDAPVRVDYPPEIAAALYWTCAEVLASASAGSEVTISVRDMDGGVAFELGVSTRDETGPSDRLRDRIEALDGSLTVETIDAGSRVQGRLPLSR